MSLVTGVARLPVARAASVPSVNVIQHPKLIPVVIAAVVAVIAVWAGISLSRWRRITWREHMDAPVSLVPKGARRAAPAGACTARSRDILRSAAYTPCFDRQQTLPATLCRP